MSNNDLRLGDWDWYIWQCFGETLVRYTKREKHIIGWENFRYDWQRE